MEIIGNVYDILDTPRIGNILVQQKKNSHFIDDCFLLGIYYLE